jgi:DNA-binding response OmpR family regulator
MSLEVNAPPVAPSPQLRTGPTRVLVIDDEPSVRMVARLMLERAGFVVEEAADAGAGLVRARASAFALVLLDVTLPDREGTEIVPELRVVAPTARLVLTSGKAEEDVPNHGADGYLPKPFSNDQLLTTVRSALRPV